jgi:hypothetical protein
MSSITDQTINRLFEPFLFDDLGLHKQQPEALENDTIIQVLMNNKSWG